LYIELLNGSESNRVKDAIEAMRKLLGDNDVLAYLVMITARLVELHRVLKPSGTLYLHCDPTASHYLKLLSDAIFGPQRFINEIIWQRAHTVKGNTGQGAKHFGRSTDSILVYAKSEKYTFNQQYEPYSQNYLKAFPPR
jgi:adenine specific DNA methylase Mod